MAIDLDDLSPYKSLLVCDAPAKWNLKIAVEEFATLAKALRDVKHASQAKLTHARHGVSSAFFYYLVEGRPSWLANDDLTNHVHELAMVFKRKDRVMLLATEARLRERLRRNINRADGTELGQLRPTARGILNAAFVRGSTKTAWLAAIDRRSDSKADNKTLGGPNLQFALDPLADQNFSLSASVSELPNKEYRHPVGTAPRKGSVWAGGSSDGDALCKDLAQLMDLIDAAAASPVSNPLPVLAAQIDDLASLKAVEHAYAAAVIPAELLNADLDPNLRILAEQWSRLELDVTASDGWDFEATVKLTTGAGAATDLGTVRIAVNASHPSALVCSATSLTCSLTMKALQDQALDAINQHPEWMKVWYESGHTLAGQAISANRFRHMPFEYTWVDFGAFQVTQEKPDPLNAKTIGKQKSLFCWVFKNWRRSPGAKLTASTCGWLACNDGSMEIADFIHFDVVDHVPELTLIHVKACGNGSVNRPIAIGDFEIVASQAAKNLYFLDRQTTADEFCDFLGKGVKDAVFHKGVAKTRNAMLKVLRTVGTNYHRRVVIVQPRITKTALAAARTGVKAKDKRIVQQLDLLLLGLKSKCMGFGAELVVVGDDC